MRCQAEWGLVSVAQAVLCVPVLGSNKVLLGIIELRNSGHDSTPPPPILPSFPITCRALGCFFGTKTLALTCFVCEAL